MPWKARRTASFGKKSMRKSDELKKIEEGLKKSSEDLFKPRPKDIEDELSKKDTFGAPDNLVERDDVEE
ncbi:hypothetical protein [Microbulbifer variabilis]|uniref:hypothetical protein n=1 Tax=Microbulbifer variabilis TaxID=266805 RepID=UPI001CFD2AF3|nr:hypothetical protein [Microbulbifer variabilis]